MIRSIVINQLKIIFGELNLKVEEDCEISLWKHEYIDVDNILNKKY